MDLTHKMGQSETLDRLFVLSGTDEDATDAFQAALDAGYVCIPGTYRIREPLRIGGMDQYIRDPTPREPGTGGILAKLTATLLPFEG